MKKAIRQLELQGKKVLVISQTLVLCKQPEDGQYVSWRWNMVDDYIALYNGRYSLDKEFSYENYSDRLTAEI